MDEYESEQIYKKAIKSGLLIRPDECFLCSQIPGKAVDGRIRIDGHHPIREKPLKVVWLCHRCHMRLHIWLNLLEGKTTAIDFVTILYKCFPYLPSKKAVSALSVLFPSQKITLNTLSTYKARLRREGIKIPDQRKRKES